MTECQQEKWGGCCCSCKYQCSIRKHPWNKADFAKGGMSEPIGYGCTVFYVNHQIDKLEGVQREGSLGNVIFSDRKHGMCEMYEERA